MAVRGQKEIGYVKYASMCERHRWSPLLHNVPVSLAVREYTAVLKHGVYLAGMDHDTFVSKVQNELNLSSQSDAEEAIRAVLQTLGERLQAGEADDLAAPLPKEIDTYLEIADSGQQFGIDEYYSRVTERMGADLPDAVNNAQRIMAIVHETVPEGEFQDLVANLSSEYADLLERTPHEPTEA